MTDTTGSRQAESAQRDATRLATAVIENVEQVILGHHEEIEHIVAALLGRGHVLLEDVPGVGKTMLARSVAASVDGEFSRVQFTPDLLPTDVTGVNVYNKRTETFEFRAGPIFGNVVLADEINRAPPKTQSALLEAMEEEQVSVDGTSHEVPQPFTVIATQNTVEQHTAYDLPMAELDRFMTKLRLGYPDAEEETAMLGAVAGTHPIADLEPVATLKELVAAREAVAAVTVEEPIRAYVTRLARYTRERARLGVSPRGSLSLLRAAQARAVMDGRGYVVPDDVQQEAPVVLPHRIRTDSSDPAEALVADALETVAVE